MIYFKIEYFKCFERFTVPLNRLTIFCGANASGKSTILQALLLFRSASLLKDGGTIRLNSDDGLSLGNAEDLLHQRNSSVADTMRFAFQLEEHSDEPGYLELSFTPSNGDDAINSGPRNLFAGPLNGIDPFKQGSAFSFTYLSAERNGPRLSQEKFSDLRTGDCPLGSRGEYSAEVLLRNERTKIRDELIFAFKETKKGADALLLQAAQQWMSSIVGEIEIKTVENGNAPPSIYYRRPGIYSDWVSSTNTGFGISYTLPIVIAGLLSKVESTLIIDSPEAHLHPAAQTALAKFLAWTAASGVRVIIETHSDHIIDGIRLATLTPELNLAPRDCSILNIRRGDDDQPEIDVLSIRANGSLSSWPKGFFDQQTSNLRNIAEAVKAINAQI